MSKDCSNAKKNAILAKILDSLSKNNSPILKFGRFTLQGIESDDAKKQNTGILEPLGCGEQGLVVKATNCCGQSYAIKFYAPESKEQNVPFKRFRQEAIIHIKIKHKNILKAHCFGTAYWISEENKWKCVEGALEKKATKDENAIFYYVMDFVDGMNSNEIFENYEKYSKINKDKTRDKINLFERMIGQIIHALKFIHAAKLLHRDIKPGNILFSVRDEQFILTDFGFAKDLKTSDSITGSSNISRGQTELVDIKNFAEALKHIFKNVINCYTMNESMAINNCLEKAVNGDFMKIEHLEKEFNSILYSYPYNKYRFDVGNFFIPSERFCKFDSTIKIPVNGSIPLSNEVRKIVDTSTFQRLRGVSQLGLTSFVYPGANHTRFEHSIGTYDMALKYIAKLLSIPEFRERIEPVDKNLKVILLAALLHDIGHYPYSHWIEEMKEFGERFNSHEQNAKLILQDVDHEITKIIVEEWGIKDTNSIANLIDVDEENQNIMTKILESPIDIDKLDYIRRDSHHCAVKYGEGFDVDRIIAGLHVDKEKDTIGLNDKYCTQYMSMLSCKNNMYIEVYWHKTVRACTAMFKRYFFAFSIEFPEVFEKLAKELIELDDNSFITKLFNVTWKDENTKDLIKPFVTGYDRKIYKPIYEYCHPIKDEKVDSNISKINKLFTIFEKEDLSYDKVVDISDNFVKVLKKKFKNDFNGIQNYHILFETTPIDKTIAPDKVLVEFYPHKKNIIGGHFDNSIAIKGYLKNNRRSYIFCHEKYAKELKEKLNKKTLNNIMKEVLKITK